MDKPVRITASSPAGMIICGIHTALAAVTAGCATDEEAGYAAAAARAAEAGMRDLDCGYGIADRIISAAAIVRHGRAEPGMTSFLWQTTAIGIKHLMMLTEEKRRAFLTSELPKGLQLAKTARFVSETPSLYEDQTREVRRHSQLFSSDNDELEDTFEAAARGIAALQYGRDTGADRQALFTLVSALGEFFADEGDEKGKLWCREAMVCVMRRERSADSVSLAAAVTEHAYLVLKSLPWSEWCRFAARTERIVRDCTAISNMRSEG